MSRFRKPRFVLVYPLVAALFIFGATTERGLHAGILLISLGALLRVWASGYVGQVKVNWTQHERGDAPVGYLVTAGPYAFVRHPLYLGTLIIGMGFCVIVGNIWLSVAAAVFFLVVYRRKMDEEEVTLQHELGGEFEAYRRAVPRWLPTGRRYAQRRGRWTWRGIAVSKEPKTVAWLVILIILLYFREEVLQERELLGGEHGIKRWGLLGLLVALVAADGIFELLRRRRRRTAQPAATGRVDR